MLQMGPIIPELTTARCIDTACLTLPYPNSRIDGIRAAIRAEARA
jgi:hypothetical protein